MFQFEQLTSLDRHCEPTGLLTELLWSRLHPALPLKHKSDQQDAATKAKQAFLDIAYTPNVQDGAGYYFTFESY